MHSANDDLALCAELKDGLLELVKRPPQEATEGSPSPNSQKMALKALRIDALRVDSERLPNATIFAVYIPERRNGIWSYSATTGKLESLPWPSDETLRLLKQLSNNSESIVLLPRGTVARLSDLKQLAWSIPPGSLMVRLDRSETSRSCMNTYRD